MIVATLHCKSFLFYDFDNNDYPLESYPDEQEDNINIGRHQFEYAMQVGPSVTVNPIDHLKINAYFRYAPSFSGILIDDEFSCNYASFFVTGLLFRTKSFR